MIIYALRQLPRVELITGEASQEAPANKSMHLETRAARVFNEIALLVCTHRPAPLRTIRRTDFASKAVQHQAERGPAPAEWQSLVRLNAAHQRYRSTNRRIVRLGLTAPARANWHKAPERSALGQASHCHSHQHEHRCRKKGASERIEADLATKVLLPALESHQHQYAGEAQEHKESDKRNQEEPVVTGMHVARLPSCKAFAPKRNCAPPLS
jgi:hypothetical protein